MPRSFLADRRAVLRELLPERRATGWLAAAESSGTSVTAASACSARDCCGTRAPRPAGVDCLRAAEPAAPATAVTPSFAGRCAARPGQSPSRPS